jgi:hypothetical protein
VNVTTVQNSVAETETLYYDTITVYGVLSNVTAVNVVGSNPGATLSPQWTYDDTLQVIKKIMTFV